VDGSQVGESAPDYVGPATTGCCGNCPYAIAHGAAAQHTDFKEIGTRWRAGERDLQVGEAGRSFGAWTTRGPAAGSR
jgi:hypothetical protein